MFYVIKLMAVSKNPILGRHSKPSLDPVIINREKEWKVEKILDSC